MSECEQSSEVKISAEENDGVEIVATSCGSNDGAGSVRIETFTSGKLTQELIYNYDTPAFSLSIESIDLNGDGISDLALGTGSGKGGEGFFYWLRDVKDGRYYAIGDYPMLSVCASNNGILYSVTPGSGKVISTWTFYYFDENEINNLLDIEVIPSDGDSLKLVALASVDGRTKHSLSIPSHVIEKDADTYLRGICSDLQPPLTFY